MSKFKTIIFTTLVCLSIFSADLYARQTEEPSIKKPKPPISIDAVTRSLGTTVGGVTDGIGKTIGSTGRGIARTVSGVTNGIGNTVKGTLGGVGKTFDGAWVEIDYLLADTGQVALDVAEAAAFIGAAFVYALYEYDGYYYNQGYHRGYNYNRPPNYNHGYYR